MYKFFQPIIDTIGPHIADIAGVLVLTAIGAYFVGFHNRRNRFADASIKFRATFLKALLAAPFF